MGFEILTGFYGQAHWFVEYSFFFGENLYYGTGWSFTGFVDLDT